MHRHGYKGKKLGRERDQRRALVKSLATALVEYESIETTLPKAKAIVPYAEKLITKAKKGDLHNRRQVIAGLNTNQAAHKLVDEIAPKLNGRESGHLRVEKTRTRVGDNAQMARVSFVDDLTAPVVAKPAKESPSKATSSKSAASINKTKSKQKASSAATKKETT